MNKAMYAVALVALLAGCGKQSFESKTNALDEQFFTPTVYVDSFTKCHYLSTSYGGNNALTPRLTREGNHFCEPKA